MKIACTVLATGVIVVSLSVSTVLADSPYEGNWDVRKERMKKEHEQTKHQYELEREEFKRYQEMELMRCSLGTTNMLLFTECSIKDLRRNW